MDPLTSTIQMRAVATAHLVETARAAQKARAVEVAMVETAAQPRSGAAMVAGQPTKEREVAVVDGLEFSAEKRVMRVTQELVVGACCQA